MGGRAVTGAGVGGRVLALLLLALGGSACRQDMHDQPRYKPLAGSSFFKDGRASRPVVEGTVPRGYARTDEHLYAGKVQGQFAEMFPFPVTREVLERGRERYDIFCAPCHGRDGYGEGMIVQRGFRPPPSFHTDRLRRAPVGYFFEVITKGFGTMYSYASRIPPEDRWAIVAYIRALQLSQHATLEDVPPAERRRLMEKRE
jgi:hypothetical protein